MLTTCTIAKLVKIKLLLHLFSFFTLQGVPKFVPPFTCAITFDQNFTFT